MEAMETLDLRLTWPVICGLAVRALVEGVDFNTICARAIKHGLENLKRNVSNDPNSRHKRTPV